MKISYTANFSGDIHGTRDRNIISILFTVKINPEQNGVSPL